MSGYDPTQSFHWLGVEDEDDAVDAEREQERDAQRLALEVFKKRGWKLIAATIRNKRDDVARDILNGHVNTMEDINRKRGEIAAYDFILSLQERAQSDYERLSEALAPQAS